MFDRFNKTFQVLLKPERFINRFDPSSLYVSEYPKVRANGITALRHNKIQYYDFFFD